MKVIIAGCRWCNDYKQVLQAIAASNFSVTEVISGGARGVDSLAIKYAIDNNLPLEIYEADWELHGRAAGPIRNEQMSKVGDALIALWDGTSSGTKNMIANARKMNLPVHVHKITKERWTYGVTNDGRWYIQDDDFTYDARLYIDGDFGSDENKESYANDLCNMLNSVRTLL